MMTRMDIGQQLDLYAMAEPIPTQREAMASAWPTLHRLMKWNSYLSTELPLDELMSPAGDIVQALDRYAHIDGLIETRDRIWTSYQIKTSSRNDRTFTIRYPHEWETLRRGELRPAWFIKVYFANGLARALGVLPVAQLVELADGREPRRNDIGQYLSIPWADTAGRDSLLIDPLERQTPPQPGSVATVGTHDNLIKTALVSARNRPV